MAFEPQPVRIYPGVKVDQYAQFVDFADVSDKPGLTWDEQVRQRRETVYEFRRRHPELVYASFLRRMDQRLETMEYTIENMERIAADLMEEDERQREICTQRLEKAQLDGIMERNNTKYMPLSMYEDGLEIEREA